MPQAIPNESEIAESKAGFCDVVQRISIERRLGLDIETDNYFRYPEHVSLIQLSVPDELYIIDPLKVDDVTPLGLILRDKQIEKIFHSSDMGIFQL